MSVIQPGSVNTHTHTHTHTQRERERDTKHAFHSPSHAHVCVRTSSPAQYFTHTYLSVRIGARKLDIFFSVSFSFLHYSLRFFLSLSLLSLSHLSASRLFTLLSPLSHQRLLAHSQCVSCSRSPSVVVSPGIFPSRIILSLLYRVSSPLYDLSPHTLTFSSSFFPPSRAYLSERESATTTTTTNLRRVSVSSSSLFLSLSLLLLLPSLRVCLTKAGHVVFFEPLYRIVSSVPNWLSLSLSFQNYLSLARSLGLILCNSSCWSPAPKTFTNLFVFRGLPACLLFARGFASLLRR